MFRVYLPRNVIDMIKSVHIAENLDVIRFPITLLPYKYFVASILTLLPSN